MIWHQQGRMSPLSWIQRGHSPTGGNEKEVPEVPTWLSPSQDLTPSLDLRTPVLDSEGLTRGLWACGL